MLRTKQGVANSFNSSDEINQIDWGRKAKYAGVFEYYKQLIALRKQHPAFRMPSATMIDEHLHFLETGPQVLAYQLSGNANGDKWADILVIMNGGTGNKTVAIPSGRWILVGDGNRIDQKGIREIKGTSVEVPGSTAFILHRK